MTIASWPESLPQEPSASNGWQSQLKDNVLRYPVEVGKPKRRRRSTSSDAIGRASFVMTGAQLATLTEFYRDDLADGTLPFSWTHPVTGLAAEWEFEEPFSEENFNLDAYRVTCSLRLIG